MSHQKTICKPLLLAAVLAAAGTTLTLPLHADAPAPARSQATFEVRFLEAMIDRHTMGVAMADLCTVRAVHPELEELCHSIIETQSAEIVPMRVGWAIGMASITSRR